MRKILDQLKRIYDHKEIIIVIGGALFTATKFVHDYWFIPKYVEPQVREMSYKLYSDSSHVWQERYIAQMPGGFGGMMADEFGMGKDEVVDSLAQMYFSERGRDMSTTYLMDRMRYQVNFNTTVFLMCTEPYAHNGIKMRKTATKESGKYDVYYKDGFDKWWKAIYYADEDAYYYIPDNSNGQRIKCD